MKPKLFLDPCFRPLEVIFTPSDMARLHELAEVVWGRDALAPEDEIDRYAQEIEYMVVGYWRHGHVSRFPRLRAILEVGGSFPSPESLEYPACFARGIRVLSCSTAFGPAVAEMALGLSLAAARQISYTDRSFRSGQPQWSHTSFATPIGEPFTHYAKEVGFIGYGGLARSLQPLLRPFGGSILAYDPWLTPNYLRICGVTPASLEEVLSNSRLLYALATPSSSNRALLDRNALERIRKDAVFVLMSRAHVVDFDALTELVLAGRFQAAIDVFPEEPFPAGHPLCRAENVVLSSHRAGAIGEALFNVGRVVIDDLEAMLAGLVPYAMQVAQPEFIRLRG